MAGGRVYYVPIDNVAIGTAVQDIFGLYVGGGGIYLHYIRLDSTNTAPAALRMRLKRGTATMTQGSGGTNPTPFAASSLNTVASATVVQINSTTQATTSGTFKTFAAFNWDTVLPFEYFPSPEDRVDAINAQEIILDLPTTIVAVTISGYAVFEEVP